MVCVGVLPLGCDVGLEVNGGGVGLAEGVAVGIIVGEPDRVWRFSHGPSGPMHEKLEGGAVTVRPLQILRPLPPLPGSQVNVHDAAPLQFNSTSLQV